MDKKDIMDKIKKCLALAGSSNENEAAIALKQAKILMEKYGITESDVQISQFENSKKEARTPHDYVNYLAGIVSRVFGCRALLNTSIFKTSWVFLGVDPAPEIADYTYTVLRRLIERDRKQFIAGLNKRMKRKKKTLLADEFCMAWIYELHEKMQTNYSDVPSVVETYMQQQNYEKVRERSTSKNNRASVDEVYNAQVAGGQKGREANVNTALKKSNATIRPALENHHLF